MTKDLSGMDPADIAKHPDIIKQALDDVSNLDVLVCGTCHQAFHHIEAFTEHKSEKCTKEDSLKECNDAKPKVWAFMLWKACQKKADEVDQHSNSWDLYQTWVNLDENIRETWIVAGKTIQSFARMGQGQLQEVPVKIIKQVGDQPKAGNENLTPVTRPVAKRNIVLSGGKKSESEQDGDTATDDDFSPQRVSSAATVRQVAKKPVQRTAISRPPPQLNTKNVMRQAIRTMSPGETEEHLVEKILAKKFNPRRRTYEYLVKWINFSHDQNTWEPHSHLEKCAVLLQSFEEQLAYQKEQRAAAAKAAEENKAANSENQPTLKRKTIDTDADAEDDQDEPQPARKVVRNEAVNQALQRAGQSGNVKIVSMNRGATIQKTTVNGATSNPKNSAEVVITSVKDKPTGVMRKPGVTSTTTPAKKEAQVHVVSRGEGVSSGIVRVAANQATKVMPKLVRTTTQVRQTPSPVKSNVVVSRTTTANPTIQRQPLLRQVSPQQQSPIVRNQTIIRRSVPAQPTPGQRTVVQRGVVKSTPSPKVATSEAKIMSLSRQGDLKIVRKSKGKSESGDDVELVYSTGSQETASSPEPIYTLCPTTGELKKPGGAQLKNKKDVQHKEAEEEKKESGTVTAIQTEDGQIQQMITNEDGSPMLVTGEDGTIYQVAGKNAEGQTLLIAQNADGEQQCVYVAAEDGDEALLAGDAAQATEGSEQQIVLKDDSAGGGASDATQQLVISTDGDSQDGNITAELVQADMPSPGGTRRVVLMLPDGNLMMTEVKF